MADDDTTPQDAAPHDVPATDASEDAVATTQELGDAGKKALDRMKSERDAAKKEAKANADAARRLAALEESQKTEAQRLAERAEAAEKQAQQAQRELSRLRVISESGLPTNLHKFVVGDDEDELRANARELLAQFSAEKRTVDVGLGPRNPAAQPADMNDLVRRLAAR